MASNEITLCFPVREFHDIDLGLPHGGDPPEASGPGPYLPGPECLSCPAAIDILILDPIDPQLQQQYLAHLGEGLRPLGEAANLEDPGAAEQSRTEAVDAFLALAEVLGETEIKLDRVGWADLENSELYEDPTPSARRPGSHASDRNSLSICASSVA